MEKAIVNVDELLHLPWISCDIEGQKHIIKYLFKEKSYKIMLSDLKCIYFEELNADSLLYRSKEMNSSIEILAQKISEQLHQTIESFIAGSCIAGVRVTILNKNSNLFVLKSESSLAGIPFIWQFNLESMDSTVNYIHLVRPLIGMVLELKRRNCELIQIIKQKNEEVSSHKAVCSQLVVKTQEFSESSFTDKMDESMSMVDSNSDIISSTFQDQLFLKIASFQTSLVNTVKNEEPMLKKPSISELNSQNESSNVVAENTNLEEEINRRQLLQHDFKRKKKFKKKRVNL